MNVNELLSVMCGQTSAIIDAFNPETLAFHNKLIELQKNCQMVEWEQDMEKSIPFCKLDQRYCNGQCIQCIFKTNDCPCDTEKR